MGSNSLFCEPNCHSLRCGSWLEFGEKFDRDSPEDESLARSLWYNTIIFFLPVPPLITTFRRARLVGSFSSFIFYSSAFTPYVKTSGHVVRAQETFQLDCSNRYLAEKKSSVAVVIMNSASLSFHSGIPVSGRLRFLSLSVVPGKSALAGLNSTKIPSQSLLVTEAKNH